MTGSAGAGLLGYALLGPDRPADSKPGKARHDMAVTRGYWKGRPEPVRAHLRCPVVDELQPIRR